MRHGSLVNGNKVLKLQSTEQLQNETNVVLHDVGTYFWQISAFKRNFRPICGL